MKDIRLTDDADYGAAHANLLKLRTTLAALRAEHVRAVEARRRVAAKPVPAGAGMVVGMEAAVVIAAAEELPDVRAIERNVAEVESAVRLQDEVLQRKRSGAASRLCATLTPEYRELLRALVESLATFGAAADDLAAFHRHYEVTCDLPLVHPLHQVPIEPHLFSLTNDQSALSRLAQRVRASLGAMPPSKPGATPEAAKPTKRTK